MVQRRYTAGEFTQSSIEIIEGWRFSNGSELAKLSIPELFARMNEMIDCESIDGEGYYSIF